MNSYNASQANDGSGEWAVLIEDQGMAKIVPHPTRPGTGDSPYQGLDLVERCGKAMVDLPQHVLDPGCGPADEVGSEQGKLLLKLHPDGRAHQVAFQGEYPFLFLDARFYESTCGKCQKERYDLSFPWQVPKQYLDSEFLPDPAKWRREQERRKGLITTVLFRIYEAVIVVHLLLFAFVVVLVTVGYFN